MFLWLYFCAFVVIKKALTKLYMAGDINYFQGSLEDTYLVSRSYMIVKCFSLPLPYYISMLRTPAHIFFH